MNSAELFIQTFTQKADKNAPNLITCFVEVGAIWQDYLKYCSDMAIKREEKSAFWEALKAMHNDVEVSRNGFGRVFYPIRYLRYVSKKKA